MFLVNETTLSKLCHFNNISQLRNLIKREKEIKIIGKW